MECDWIPASYSPRVCTQRSVCVVWIHGASNVRGTVWYPSQSSGFPPDVREQFNVSLYLTHPFLFKFLSKLYYHIDWKVREVLTTVADVQLKQGRLVCAHYISYAVNVQHLNSRTLLLFQYFFLYISPSSIFFFQQLKEVYLPLGRKMELVTCALNGSETEILESDNLMWVEKSNQPLNPPTPFVAFSQANKRF